MVGISARKREQRRGRHIDVGLRGPHIHYLEYIAELHDLSLSGALGFVLEQQAHPVLSNQKPPRKVRKHLWIDPGHAELLTKLSLHHGVSKADITRRLIDAAMAEDNMGARESAYLARRRIR